MEVEVLPKGMLPKDAPAHPDPRLMTELRYRLADGREFGSPSAAGTAVTGLSCNGWAFWSVGDGGETTGPVRSTTTRAPRSKAQPAPKPQTRRRGRKAQEPPASDAQAGDEGATTRPQPRSRGRSH